VAPETRKFTPHVTLARLKRAPLTKVFPYLEANAGFETQPFEVLQVLLFRSHLGSRGADYEVLSAYPENI
jgi:2'-5' RNA ligase